MGFCVMCGRPRADSDRFCTVCGADFAEQAAAGAQATAPAPAENPPPAPAWEATRWEAPPPVTTPAQPAWPGSPPGDPWLASPTQSLVLPPSPAAPNAPSPPPMPPAYQPPGYQPGYQPPAYEPPGYQLPPSRRGRNAAIIVALIVFVLAAGGGAFALISVVRRHSTAAPPGRPTVQPASHSGPATAPATPTPRSPATAGSTPASTATASPSPAPSPGAVSVAPGVAASPLTPGVEDLLNRYFSAINARDYQAYNSLLDAQMQASDSSASFYSGYATTKDSAETLTAISGTAGGGVAATVTFISHQNAANSINNSTCTDWTITLYLVPQGSSYVITAPPPGYHSSHLDC